MKKMLLFGFIFFASTIAYCQKAVIEDGVAEYATYTYKIPEISEVREGKIGYTVLKKLNTNLLIAIFGEDVFINDAPKPTKMFSAQDLASAYASNIKASVAQSGMGQGCTNLDYEITHNDNGILSLTFQQQFMGAYPSGFSNMICLSLLDGSTISENALYNNYTAQAAVHGILEKIINARATEKLASIEDINTEDPFAITLKKPVNISGNLPFQVSRQGITYQFLFGFPHVAQSMEPDPNYLLTWDVLSPYIDKKGLFATFYK